MKEAVVVEVLKGDCDLESEDENKVFVDRVVGFGDEVFHVVEHLFVKDVDLLLLGLVPALDCG